MAYGRPLTKKEAEEWMERALSTPHPEPDPEPVTLAEFQALHPPKPKEVDFLSMARELNVPAAEQRQTITAYVMMKNPLRILNVGGEGRHFVGIYDSLAQVIRERTALGRKTAVQFFPGFTSGELRRHLTNQHAPEVFDKFIAELKRCTVIATEGN